MAKDVESQAALCWDRLRDSLTLISCIHIAILKYIVIYIEYVAIELMPSCAFGADCADGAGSGEVCFRTLTCGLANVSKSSCEVFVRKRWSGVAPTVPTNFFLLFAAKLAL